MLLTVPKNFSSPATLGLRMLRILYSQSVSTRLPLSYLNITVSSRVSRDV